MQNFSIDSAILPYANNFYSGYWGSGHRVFSCQELSRELEFPENPSRSPRLADQLQAVIDNPIGGAALAITCSLILSSSEGDEIGIAIERDEAVKSRTSANRMVEIVRYAMSGFTVDDLWQICWRFLAWGDCFASIVEDDTGKLKPWLLPTWQIHLDADQWDGSIKRVFHKRPGIEKESEVQLDTLVHWCYQKNHLYGRSLFWTVRNAAEYYRQSDEDLAVASRDSALSPNIHVMPEGADSAYLEAYKRDHKEQLKRGPVSDIYVFSGAGVSKADGGQPALDAMITALNQRAKQIAIASRVPPYLLGIESQGAKEISLQPAMVFKNHVGWCRSILSSGLRVAIDRLLLSKGFTPPFPYRLVYPKLVLNPYQPELDEDMQKEGISDSD